MAGSRSKKVLQLPTTEENKFIAGKVHYDDGNSGYRPARRGYYLIVTPETHRDGFVTVVAYSGTKKLIEEAARFNQRKLDNLMPDQGVIDELVAYVAEKNNLTLKGEEEK